MFLINIINVPDQESVIQAYPGENWVLSWNKTGMVLRTEKSEEEAAFKPESSPASDEISRVDRYGKSFFNETCELTMKFVGKPYAEKCTYGLRKGERDFDFFYSTSHGGEKTVISYAVLQKYGGIIVENVEFF
jgi:hypothetical protein